MLVPETHFDRQLQTHHTGSSTFCPLLLLLPSGVSLKTAANFLVFLNLAIFFEGKNLSVVKTESILFLVLLKVSSKSEEIKFKQFKQSKQVIFRELQYSKSQFFIIIIVLSLLLFIPFHGGKHNCLHARLRYK